MDLTCRNTNYNKISQILNTLLAKYNKKVSIGSSCNCLEAKIVLFTNVKEILSCYRPYTSELTYLYSLQIIRPTSESVTVDLTIGSDTFSYTGIETGISILFNLRNQINQSTDLIGYIVGNTLYIYSYSTNVNFSTPTTFDSTVESTVGILTNLENSPNTLVDLWNCLTSEQICKLVNSVYELEPEC